MGGTVVEVARSEVDDNFIGHYEAGFFYFRILYELLGIRFVLWTRLDGTNGSKLKHKMVYVPRPIARNFDCT